MVRAELIDLIKKELSALEKRDDILAVLLYGSQLNEEFVTNRSDIDICVVAPSVKDHVKLQFDLFTLVRNSKYDIRVFELLPLYLKMEVIKNHVVIFTKNRLDLYEYFYFYRKIWKDQEYRNTLRADEYIELLANKRKYYEKRKRQILSKHKN